MLIAVSITIIMMYIYLAWKKPELAIVTSLLPTCVISIYDISTSWTGSFSGEGIAAICTTLCIIPITVIVIRIGEAYNKNTGCRWPQKAARIILVIFRYLLLMGILIALLNVLGFVLWIALVITIIRYKFTKRHAVSANVISTISAAMKQNLPLSSALSFATGKGVDKRAVYLRQISERLSEGYSLGTAIEKGFPSCQSDVLGRIKTAEDIHQLPEVLDSIVKDQIEAADSARHIKSVHPLYPAIVLAATAVMALGLSIFIMPTFAEVIADLSPGASLPAITQIQLDIARFFLTNNGIWLILLALGFVAVLWFFSLVNFRLNRYRLPGFISSMIDWIGWHLPVYHWFEKNRAQLQVANMLRIWLSAGYPIDQAIEKAAQIDMNHCYVKKLRKWHRQVLAGENVSESARKLGISKTISWALDNKINTSNVSMVLGMVEDISRANYNYAGNMFRSTAWPATILCMGLVVGFVVVSFFVPMVEMLNILVADVIP